ncbi:MAG TPA: TetR/AcrR family transcriptional regulator [Myxococcota bacterium]|nr:TetR/AcrR family transcriptional regulator [Myxococcota bacterium]
MAEPVRSPAATDPEAPTSPGVAARRRRILEAAARCFAKSGFARTRMEDVAAAARVSRALVHHHFGSKEELAREVQANILDEWSAAVDRAIEAAPSAGEAFAAWLRVNLTDTRRLPLLHAILADAALLASFEDAARRSMAEWREKLVALLRRGQAQGEFRADLDVESTAEVLRAMQVGMMQQLLSDDPALDVSGERHLAAASQLLVAGLRRAP